MSTAVAILCRYLLRALHGRQGHNQSVKDGGPSFLSPLFPSIPFLTSSPPYFPSSLPSYPLLTPFLYTLPWPLLPRRGQLSQVRFTVGKTHFMVFLIKCLTQSGAFYRRAQQICVETEAQYDG